MDLSKNSPVRTLLLIILLGAAVRLINIGQPLLEGASTRQVETAMIARNFYNGGFKLFYPQIDGFGENPGYVMQEFYVIPFIAALFYKIFGGVHELILRLISVFFYISATVIVYKLAAYLFNKRIGLISAFCFTVSPLSIYLGRAVHPEMAIVFFNTAAVYSFIKWTEKRNWFYALATAASFTMAVLLKIPDLYLIAPLLFIGLVYQDKNIFKERQFWLPLLMSFSVIAVFNLHQYLVRAAYPNPVMENFDPKIIFNYVRLYLTKQAFYKKIYEDLLTYTLTPIGFTIFILGLLMKIESKREWLFCVWLSAIGLFFLIMPAQCIQGYYQMHLLPAASIVIAKAAYYFSESEFYKNRFFRKKTFIFLFLSSLFLVVFRYSYAYYKVPENFRHVVETGKAVDLLTEKGSLVISSIENGPDLVYYSNRKGWPFMVNLEEKMKEDIAWGEDTRGRIYNSISYLEYLRSNGAEYFASASMEEFFGNKKFSGYMLKNYKTVKQTPHFIILDLKEKTNHKQGGEEK